MLEGAFDEELQALTPNFLAVSLAQRATRLCGTTGYSASTPLPPMGSCLRWRYVFAVDLWLWGATQGWALHLLL